MSCTLLFTPARPMFTAWQRRRADRHIGPCIVPSSTHLSYSQEIHNTRTPTTKLGDVSTLLFTPANPVFTAWQRRWAVTHSGQLVAEGHL